LVNGRLAAMPVARGGITGGGVTVRQQHLDQLGIDVSQVTNKDDLLTLWRQLTSAPARWAFGGSPLPLALEMFRAPNVWALNGGQFTKDWETEEYREAVAFSRALWDAQVIHPDSPSMAGSALTLLTGKFSFTNVVNIVAYPDQFDAAWRMDPNFK